MEGITRPRDEDEQGEFESRVEAPFAVIIAIGIQLFLGYMSVSRGWKLWWLPGWVWFTAVVPEVILVLALMLPGPRRHLEHRGLRRVASIVLVAVIALMNLMALVALVGSLLRAEEKVGWELLLKGFGIWGTNVITYGLLFWEFDGGGPEQRREARDAVDRDFQFPQMENPSLVSPGWQPHLIDYIYVSFTNSIAFSPTDAMPLRHRAKLLMIAESATSALAVLLVAARAVNILV
jgi:hypothetical protein